MLLSPQVDGFRIRKWTGPQLSPLSGQVYPIMMSYYHKVHKYTNS